MNSLPAAALTVREYLRVSAEGERSIPEQRQDNKRAADREGFALGSRTRTRGAPPVTPPRGVTATTG
ncbi:hypothetical protein [Streptomyces atratus]|uniref:hypothetical protein n=1 Tax=Streptomyces atratus TaxID=1893 RepID=UPI00340ACC50